MRMLALGLLTWTCLTAVDPWYRQIPPGATREVVHHLGGLPGASDGAEETYRLSQGYLRLRYRDHMLISCDHMDPGGGALSKSVYWRWGDEDPGPLAERTAFIEAGRFERIPGFSGPTIRTAAEQGVCYPVGDRVLIVEPIVTLLGGIGPFTDKAARVTLVGRDGTRTVLYRASEHWERLRPPALSPAEVGARTDRLKAIGERAAAKVVMETLGKPDGQMGSGDNYSLYYVSEGLLVCSEPGDRWWIERPGADATVPAVQVGR